MKRTLCGHVSKFLRNLFIIKIIKWTTQWLLNGNVYELFTCNGVYLPWSVVSMEMWRTLWWDLWALGALPGGVWMAWRQRVLSRNPELIPLLLQPVPAGGKWWNYPPMSFYNPLHVIVIIIIIIIINHYYKLHYHFHYYRLVDWCIGHRNNKTDLNEDP